jgi:phage-related protein
LLIVKAKAQFALNAVMAANPITLVVLAIAALVAAFVVAYKTSETFRNFINGLFGSNQNRGYVIGRVFALLS